MPFYRFKAIDAKGAVTYNVSSATNLEALTKILNSQGLFLMEAREAKPNEISQSTSVGPPATMKNRTDLLSDLKISRVPLDKIAMFTTELAIMVRTALPIAESLDSLARQQPHPGFQEAIRLISKSVQGGQSLSQSFGRFPKIFDDVYVSLLSAGEASGKVDVMLERIAGYLNFRRELKSKVRAALLYPSIIVATSIAVVAFLILFILPTFAEIFSQLEIELPWPTRLLLFISNHLRRFWWLYLGALTGSWILFGSWLSKAANRRSVHRLELDLPLIGALVRNIVMTRALRTLASCVSSGVPILQSLSLAQAAAGNVIFHEIFGRVYRSANEGRGLALSLGGNGYVPQTVMNMVSNAERTGTLPEVLEKVADYYERETDTSLKELFTVLEPAFVFLLGLLVAGIAFAVLLPILQLDTSI
ncbi:MAG: type II secretion system F family protein [Elusimicrobia bacterium]|nr:type II secretion system F family protein [Elusimicrobiota bacterium]